MKTTFFGLGLLAAAVASANAIHYHVASCAELKAIDDGAVSALTITRSDFECDTYTRFRVRNDMTLKSDWAAVVFTNFALKVLGDLTVEPDVTFQNVTEQETNGGALYVDRASSAIFRGTTRFLHNSVTFTQYSGGRNSYKVHDGGAIYNKGQLAFEGDATFRNNEALTDLSTQNARGGAIYNAKFGTVTFNADLTVTEGTAEGFFQGNGGAIYTNGEVVVEGKSTFTDNASAEGGSIFITKTGTITFKEFATFTNNAAYDFRGGAIFNHGSLNLMGGSLFLNNYASDSGDGGSGGGIYNAEYALLSFGGDNTFDANGALNGGAIFNEQDGSISYPEDDGELIFQNLRGETCPGIFYDLEDTDTYTCGP